MEERRNYEELNRRMTRMEVTMYGDPDIIDDIGMSEKVNKMYIVLTQGTTIKDFVITIFKLIISVGLFSGAVITINTLFHKI